MNKLFYVTLICFSFLQCAQRDPLDRALKNNDYHHAANILRQAHPGYSMRKLTKCLEKELKKKDSENACIHLLISYGASPNIFYPEFDGTQQTYLHLFASQGNEGMIRCLLACGADSGLLNTVCQTAAVVAQLSGKFDCARILEHAERKLAPPALMPMDIDDDTQSNEPKCVICQEELSSQIQTTLSCGHIFHAQCTQDAQSAGLLGCSLCKQEHSQPTNAQLEAETVRKKQAEEEANQAAILAAIADLEKEFGTEI